jgi:type IV pilus assembly protein PilY1
LHGQLWKLNFTMMGISDWNMQKLSSFKTGSGSSLLPYPLYISKDASGNIQPITMPPLIANSSLADTHYVLFGTGKYLESTDKTSTAQQSTYMIYDNASAVGDVTTGTAVAISSRLRLKQGTVNTSTGLITVPAFTLGRATTDVNTEVIRSGWYFDLPRSAERQVSQAVLSGDSAVFSSLIPGVSASTGTCTAVSGSGYTYAVSFASGSGSATVSTVGLLGAPIVLTYGADTNSIGLGPTDNTGRRLRTTPNPVLTLGSDGVTRATTQSTVQVVGRLNWRQINNFQDIKN